MRSKTENINRGISLIELLVVVFIIALMSTIVFVGYQGGRERLALERSTHMLAQDIRHAQELAMRAEDFRGSASWGGFGIHLVGATTSYVLFADCDQDRFFTAITGAALSCATATTANRFNQSEELERRLLEEGVRIVSVLPNPSTIVFIPPDPAIRINNGAVTSTTITLEVIVGGLPVTTIIDVNQAGLISIR